MRTLFIAIFIGLAMAPSVRANDYGVFLQGPGVGAYYSHGRPPRIYSPPIVVPPRTYPGYGYGAPYAGAPYSHPVPYYGGGYRMRRGPVIRCRHYVDAWGKEISQQCWRE